MRRGMVTVAVLAALLGALAAPAVAGDFELTIQDMRTGFFRDGRTGDGQIGAFGDLFALELGDSQDEARRFDLTFSLGIIDKANDEKESAGIFSADIVQVLNALGRLADRHIIYKQSKRFNLGFYAELNKQLNPFADEFKPDYGYFLTVELFRK